MSKVCTASCSKPGQGNRWDRSAHRGLFRRIPGGGTGAGRRTAAARCAGLVAFCEGVPPRPAPLPEAGDRYPTPRGGQEERPASFALPRGARKATNLLPRKFHRVATPMPPRLAT